jgi:hypothetical protein
MLTPSERRAAFDRELADCEKRLAARELGDYFLDDTAGLSALRAISCLDTSTPAFELHVYAAAAAGRLFRGMNLGEFATAMLRWILEDSERHAAAPAPDEDETLDLDFGHADDGEEIDAVSIDDSDFRDIGS